MLNLAIHESEKSTNDRIYAASLHIRPIRAADAPALRTAFERLSDMSRYYRFHSGMRHLSDGLLRYLTEVDGVDHVALIAWERSASGEPHGVGVARFIRNRDAPNTAEVAVTVIDEAQGRGVGRSLLAALSDAARERSIHTFTLNVLSGNTRARRLLRRLGATGQGNFADVITFHLPVAALAHAA